MRDLKDKFQKFVGQIVKHPNRVTCDMCDTTSALSDLAFEEDLMLSFNIAGKPANDMDAMMQQDMMVVDLIENDDGRLIVHDMHIN